MNPHQEIAAGADEGFSALLLMSLFHQIDGEPTGCATRWKQAPGKSKKEKPLMRR
jgi:hypothetical protein